MLVCYAFENRNTWFILAFALACGLGSLYGFLQGAWPCGLVEAIWALVAARRWGLAARLNFVAGKTRPLNLKLLHILFPAPRKGSSQALNIASPHRETLLF